LAVTRDISATYRGPGAVMRRLLSDGRREDRALGFVLFAGVLTFVAQAPWQARAAFYDPSVPQEARLYWSAFFFIFIVPLLAYGLAAVLHLIAKGLGGKGNFYRARLALFWSLLAATPLALLTGLMAGFVGPGLETTATGVLWVAVFLWFLVRSLMVAESASA
jgi:hypothetical protein